MNLKHATKDELQAELALRERSQAPPPRPSAEPDFTELIRIIVEGTKTSIANGYEDDDLRGYIVEAAMAAVYGNGYWAWRNAQKWSG